MMDRNKLGMLLFVASESVFFMLLIGAYVSFRSTGGTGPTAANSLDPIKTGIFSVCLFSSSLTMWLAELNRKRSKRAWVSFWLLATVVLGTIFLIGQGSEYAHLLRENVTISRDLFGTTFFTMTGFHGMHVFGGLAMLVVLLGLSLRGSDQDPSFSSMESVAIYWHFVDAVWVVIFSIVYLWGFL